MTYEAVEEATHSGIRDQQYQHVSTTTLSVPWAPVHKVLRYNLKLYPYKIGILQELKPQEPQQRIDFTNFILCKFEDVELWIRKIL